MNHPTYNAWLAQQHRADREEAYDNACDAYNAIEALQRCDAWQELPLSLRRLLCASHATLGALADALTQESEG